mgnify:CR=1 FL=1
MQYVGTRCPENAQGFTGQDLKVTEWAFKDGGDLTLTVRNQGGGNDINITDVELGGTSARPNQEITYGSDSTFTVNITHGLSRGECYSEAINITYNIGEITGKKISGTLNGKY